MKKIFIVLLALIVFGGISACSAADNVTSDNATSDLVVENKTSDNPFSEYNITVHDESNQNMTIDYSREGNLFVTLHNMSYFNNNTPSVYIYVDNEICKTPINVTGNIVYMHHTLGISSSKYGDVIFNPINNNINPGMHNITVVSYNPNTVLGYDWIINSKFYVTKELPAPDLDHILPYPDQTPTKEDYDPFPAINNGSFDWEFDI